MAVSTIFQKTWLTHMTFNPIYKANWAPLDLLMKSKYVAKVWAFLMLVKCLNPNLSTLNTLLVPQHSKSRCVASAIQWWTMYGYKCLRGRSSQKCKLPTHLVIFSQVSVKSMNRGLKEGTLSEWRRVIKCWGRTLWASLMPFSEQMVPI